MLHTHVYIYSYIHLLISSIQCLLGSQSIQTQTHPMVSQVSSPSQSMFLGWIIIGMDKWIVYYMYHGFMVLSQSFPQVYHKKTIIIQEIHVKILVIQQGSKTHSFGTPKKRPPSQKGRVTIVTSSPRWLLGVDGWWWLISGVKLHSDMPWEDQHPLTYWCVLHREFSGIIHNH